MIIIYIQSCVWTFELSHLICWYIVLCEIIFISINIIILFTQTPFYMLVVDTTYSHFPYSHQSSTCSNVHAPVLPLSTSHLMIFFFFFFFFSTDNFQLNFWIKKLSRLIHFIFYKLCQYFTILYHVLLSLFCLTNPNKLASLKHT